mgnify:CR=1 FL=1
MRRYGCSGSIWSGQRQSNVHPPYGGRGQPWPGRETAPLRCPPPLPSRQPPKHPYSTITIPMIPRHDATNLVRHACLETPKVIDAMTSLLGYQREANSFPSLHERRLRPQRRSFVQDAGNRFCRGLTSLSPRQSHGIRRKRVHATVWSCAD